MSDFTNPLDFCKNIINSDDAKRVRRQVILVAGSIILFTLLDIQWTNIKIFGLGDAISPFRAPFIEVILTVVLFYLAFRYFLFTKSCRLKIKKIKDYFLRNEMAVMRINKYCKTNKCEYMYSSFNPDKRKGKLFIKRETENEFEIYSNKYSYFYEEGIIEEGAEGFVIQHHHFVVDKGLENEQEIVLTARQLNEKTPSPKSFLLRIRRAISTWGSNQGVSFEVYTPLILAVLAIFLIADDLFFDSVFMKLLGFEFS